MTMKFLIAGAGLAALAAAAPASAQYGYPSYGYGYYPPTYGGYTHPNANITQFAVNQCTAAVQARLNNRRSLESLIGSLVGAYSATGRVLTVSSVNPSSTRIRVRGLASSGQMAANPYGYGYYGAVGYGYSQPADLSYRCDVDYSGRVRSIDIDRRR